LVAPLAFHQVVLCRHAGVNLSADTKAGEAECLHTAPEVSPPTTTRRTPPLRSANSITMLIDITIDRL
jgi:hypothetical protein